jgi:hypothetical protein
MAWLAVDASIRLCRMGLRMRTVRLRILEKPVRRMYPAFKCVSACCDMDNVLSDDIEMVK